MALPGFFGKHGEQGHLFQGRGTKCQNLEGWTKALRNRDHNKNFFLNYGGTWEQATLFQRNK